MTAFVTDPIKVGDTVRFTRTRYSTVKGVWGPKTVEKLFYVTEIFQRSAETGYLTVFGYYVNQKTGARYSTSRLGVRSCIGISPARFVRVEPKAEVPS